MIVIQNAKKAREIAVNTKEKIEKWEGSCCNNKENFSIVVKKMSELYQAASYLEFHVNDILSKGKQIGGILGEELKKTQNAKNVIADRVGKGVRSK